jgi:arylformamidase
MMNMRKNDRVTLSAYCLGAHSGTHIDAPQHFIKEGVSVDEVPLTALIGPARVIDFPSDVTAIDAAQLNKHNWKGAKRILLRTRSSHEKWIVDPKFRQDFPYLAPDAAQLLADEGVELVGIDYLSIEKYGSAVPKTHQILLGKNIPVVEGLDLRNVEAGEYDLIVLPLRIVGHEGAPARAVLRKRH